jgi:protein-disulfide isomerase
LSKKSRGKVQESAPRSPYLVALILAAVVGIAVVAYTVSTNIAETGMATTPVVVPGLDDPQTLIQMAEGVTLGDPNAPITIIEFGDYQCPSCRAFHQQVKPRVELAYVQPGIAKFVFYDYPLSEIHPNAFLAARAARCAGEQQKYFEYHDALFLNQTAWAGSTTPRRLFVGYAEQVEGLDAGAFETCLRGDRFADVVTANRRLGEEAFSVSSTPTIFVRGSGLPDESESDFESISRAVEALRQGQGG